MRLTKAEWRPGNEASKSRYGGVLMLAENLAKRGDTHKLLLHRDVVLGWLEEGGALYQPGKAPEGVCLVV